MFHTRTISIIFFALLLSGPARAAGGVDMTRVYLNAFRSDCAFGAAQIAALRRYKVLLVPGYFSDIDPAYFADQSRWLASISVDHQRVAVMSRQGMAVNAPIIAAAIRASTRPVILISHSKGSVDVIEALRADSLLRKKVSGWISLQGVFFGSPVADMLLDDARLSPLLTSIVLGVLGGSRESAQGLTTAAAGAYYRNHQTAIDAVVREVPAVAFGSALDGAAGGQAETTLKIPYELMWRDGIRNDGLVPLEATVLPGMDFVQVTGLDHIAPVMPALLRFDRVRMTKAMLLTLRTPLRQRPPDAGCKTD